MLLDGLFILAGFGLIGLMLFDVFETLFNPQRGGSPSHRLLNALWRNTRGSLFGSGRGRVFTGPLFIVIIILGWILSALVGWALIYYVFLPGDGVLISPGLAPEDVSEFIDAMYVSGVMLVTLGLGDVTPKHDFLRIVVPLQGGIGFLLLTAGITWVLGIYPVLARRQQLAQTLHVLHAQLGDQGFASQDLESSEVAALSRDLTQKLFAVRSDMTQFPITFYFLNWEPDASLPDVIEYLPVLLDSFPREQGSLRYAATRGMLERAYRSFAETLQTVFLQIDDGDRVVEIYAQWAGIRTGDDNGGQGQVPDASASDRKGRGSR